MTLPGVKGCTTTRTRAREKIKTSQLKNRRLVAYVLGSLFRCAQWDDFQRDP